MKADRRVFLSYAHADREAVLKVASCLRASGVSTWDPEQEILPGSDWMAALNQALASAQALIVFISPKAIASRDVTREIEYALGAKHLAGRLIPVVLEPTKNSPWVLKLLPSVQYETPAKTSDRILKILSQPSDAFQTKQSA